MKALMNDARLGFETICTHFAEDPERQQGAVTVPIYQNSLFTFPDCDTMTQTRGTHRWDYTRVGNPTTDVLQRKLAALEHTDRCIVSASGMGAISSAIVGNIRGGDHVICVNTVYGPTRMLLDDLHARFGLSISYVDGRNLNDFENEWRAETKLVYLESPSSMLFRQQDLEGVARLAKSRGAVTVCDNSWATPYFQNPADLGVDLVAHTASKYLGGHSDLIGGAVCGPERLMQRIASYEHPLFGATADPFMAWLVLRAVRTLAVRLERHQQNARVVATFLEQHPKIARVYYPGSATYSQPELREKQLKGTSGLMSVALKENTQQATFRFVDRLKLFYIGCSWGGYESLAIPFTAAGLVDDDHPWCARLHIGLETQDDLIADIEQALS